MRTAFADEGDIRSTDILAALVTLWRESASGSLHFSRSGATAGFHLSAGEVTAIWSSDSRFETASILLRAGKLDASTLERLSTPEGGDRALSALQAGVLTKREWRWGEKIRGVEVLSDLLTWIEGDYVFDRGAHADAGEFRLTVPRLVLELFLRSRDRALVLHYLGGADVPLARAPHFEAEFAAFGLTADAEAVVRLIDGKATAAQIASEGPAEPFAVEKLLAALVTLGLVHPEFVAAESGPQGTAEGPARELEKEEEEEATEVEDAEERAETTTAYTELDASSPSEAGDANLDRALGEPTEVAPLEGEEEEPEIGGDRELGEEASIAGERLRPALGGELESPLDRATYDRVAEPGDRETGGAELPETRPSAPAFDLQRPLDLATGIGSIGRPKPRSPGPLLWLLAFLAAGVAVVILLRGHGSSTRTVAAAAAAETPSPTVAFGGEAAVLSVVASPLPTEAPPALSRTSIPAKEHPTRPAAVPTRAPARAALPVAPARAATPSREAPGGSRQAWLDRAARDRQRATADGKAQFTIQVELACEISTLVDAWKYDRPAGTLWVLTTPFDGKTCFRVLWGRYSTKEAARRALSAVPPFFSSAHNHPAVTAIR